jgi:hypothetical protein
MTDATPRDGEGESSAAETPQPQPEPEHHVPDTTRQVEGISALGFFPADHAASEGGKVYANGAYWSHLRFPSFPATLPICALVAVLQLPYHQTHRDHTLVIRLVDAQGQDHPFRAEGGFRTAHTMEAEFGEAAVVPFTVPVTSLEFERPGAYRFILEVDGEFVADYGFRVIQLAVPGMPGVPGQRTASEG